MKVLSITMDLTSLVVVTSLCLANALLSGSLSSTAAVDEMEFTTEMLKESEIQSTLQYQNEVNSTKGSVNGHWQLSQNINKQSQSLQKIIDSHIALLSDMQHVISSEFKSMRDAVQFLDHAVASISPSNVNTGLSPRPNPTSPAPSTHQILNSLDAFSSHIVTNLTTFIKQNQPIVYSQNEIYNCLTVGGALLYGGCVRYYSGEKNWTDAEDLCRQWGGTLLFPPDLDDDGFAFDLLTQFTRRFFSTTSFYAIGARNNGIFYETTRGLELPNRHRRWIIGETFTSKNKRNDLTLIERDCVFMKVSKGVDYYEIGDYGCYNKHPFFCII